MRGFSVVLLGGAAIAAQGQGEFGAETAPAGDRAGASTRERSVDVARSMAGGMIPVHSGDDERAHDYGIWAAGPDYKVSFHDGMTFYPLLGADAPRNLPVRWDTTSVRVGERELGGEAARAARRGIASDWRYEYRYPGFVEAYDVREDGVEQTFVLRDAPASRGDLVIAGTLSGALAVDGVIQADGSVALRDGTGREVVRYGRALAFDASGALRDVRTTVRNGRVELRLDGDWLASAAFPVTVDPLISSKVVAGTGAQPEITSIARDDGNDELMVVFTRATSAADHDVYAYLMRDDYSQSTAVYTDLSASWSSESVDVAYVAGPRKWVVGFNRIVTSSSIAYLRVHLHDGGDYSLRSGLMFLRSTDWANEISVGGCASTSAADEALIVYRHDAFQPNTDASEIRGTIIDCATLTSKPEFTISSTVNAYDSERPDVIEQRAFGSDPWIVVYDQFNTGTAGDDIDPYVVRVDDDSGVSFQYLLGNNASSVHGMGPRVGGRDGEYMVAYAERRNTFRPTQPVGDEIWTQRFSWPRTASAPTVGTRNVTRYGTTMVVTGVAHDHLTNSHWTYVAEEQVGSTPPVFIDRCGHDGKRVEYATITSGLPHSGPSITFDDDAAEYSVAYVSADRVLGTKLIYPGAAGSTPYGSECGAASISARGTSHANLPYAGTNNFGIRIQGAPRGTVAVLMVGSRQAALDLTGVGMTGCTLYVDPTSLLASLPVSLVSSQFDLGLTIPSTITGDAYFQWAYINPNANPFGAEATQGLSVNIR